MLNFTSILFAITVVAALTSLDSDSAFQEAAPMQPVESQGDYAPQIPVYNTSSKESIAQSNSTNQPSQEIPQTFQTPLEQMKQNYASTFAAWESLCGESLRGKWIDSTSEIGCYDMKMFIQVFCSMNEVQQIMQVCQSAGGNPKCSSSQISCSF